MNQTFKSSAILLSALILTACGSSSDNSSSHNDEHAHSLLITQTGTNALSVLEEGEPESLEGVADDYAAALLLADSGEAAAIITSGMVKFVTAHHGEEDESDAHEDEHELPEVSVTTIQGDGIKVVNSKGHFSVLVDGATQLVPYESLEGETPLAEELNLPIATEVYPAFILEEDALAIGFDGATVAAYENTGSGFTEKTGTSLACEEVKSAAQTTLVEEVDEVPTVVADFVMVSCNNTGTAKNYKVELKHDTDSLTVVELTPAVTTLVDWKTRAGVFVGKGDDDQFYVAEEDHETGALELVDTLEGTQGFAATENSAELCAWGIDSASADIFTLTADTLTVFNHEGESHSITLDETEGAVCDELILATANNAVFVIDNQAQVLYAIDKEEGSSVYHIHDRETLSVNDVADAVVFHEVGSEVHDHEH